MNGSEIVEFYGSYVNVPSRVGLLPVKCVLWHGGRLLPKSLNGSLTTRRGTSPKGTVYLTRYTKGVGAVTCH